MYLSFLSIKKKNEIYFHFEKIRKNCKHVRNVKHETVVVVAESDIISVLKILRKKLKFKIDKFHFVYLLSL